MLLFTLVETWLIFRLKFESVQNKEKVRSRRDLRNSWVRLSRKLGSWWMQTSVEKLIAM